MATRFHSGELGRTACECNGRLPRGKGKQVIKIMTNNDLTVKMKTPSGLLELEPVLPGNRKRKEINYLGG